ncbi:ABC-type dipeptide/oligopeptide/nickel transport system permease subunit [Geomicrobium halophilum]|uniref:ABC-type dipeptide/oligopeptide/nickel transport system permease subunit n=1 Tax=Geomicrobium halophilum TaxID=549000 RepID=A0A841PLX5_9BACL|nr:ABC transporter permease [Geomicrobium halophilum]MBB6448704.1 ABC-type dipeptide/oligopeptide/nickel transport system permease subunit [Geomicrobium halophilum]
MFSVLWKKKALIFSSSILLLAFLFALFAPFVVPVDPFAGDTSRRLLPPSAEYWFGTDHLGRDVFSRLLYGARYSFLGALVVAIIAAILSIVIGTIAGYRGGCLDQIFMRISEWMLAFPSLMIALVLVGIFGPGMLNLMFALILVFWMPGARLVRNMIVRLKEERYVHVARLHGGSSFRIITRHLLPFVLPHVLVLATLDVGSVLLHIAGFSFLGLGIQPPLPEWGAMLNTSSDYFYSSPWLMIFPGLIIFVIVLSFNILSDHWREIFHIKK